uniref:Putative NAC domain class transcription factor n=1 Tax=Tamarix hispida TaxID=189793 RepID=T2C9X9_9CARY|nr:putative NAC domain class transcription factor [Tamarix hispida]
MGNDDAPLENSTQSVETSEPHPPNNGGLPKETHQIPPICKLETPDDCPISCTPDSELLTLGPNKRLRRDLGSCNSNASEFSTSRTNGCSTSITNSSSTLLEFPLLEPIGPKDEPSLPLGMIDINMPPSYLKLFEELRSEIYKLSIEKESMKIEVMSARTMINMLQTKIDHLSKENDDVKRDRQRGNIGIL